MNTSRTDITKTSEFRDFEAMLYNIVELTYYDLYCKNKHKNDGDIAYVKSLRAANTAVRENVKALLEELTGNLKATLEEYITTTHREFEAALDAK